MNRMYDDKNNFSKIRAEHKEIEETIIHNNRNKLPHNIANITNLPNNNI